MGLLKNLFSTEQLVDRKSYATLMLSLFALYYLGEAGSAYFFSLGKVVVWPWQTLTSVYQFRFPSGFGYSGWYMFYLAFWFVPFYLISFLITIRRCIDAGTAPALSLLLMVPGLNIILFIILSAAPSNAATSVLQSESLAKITGHKLRSAILGIFAATVLGLILMLVNVFGFNNYGWSLFVGTPAVLGLVTGYLFNRHEIFSKGQTAWVASLGVTIIGGALLLFALEGVMCLAMAVPIAYPLAILGALLGRLVAQRYKPTLAKTYVFTALALLPAISSVEPRVTQSPLRSVTTSILIEAAPEEIWNYIVEVPLIPPPEEWEFQTGIAFPTEAYVTGYGVGATRVCTFNTGDVVETITEFEKNRRLKFRVLSQPHPMKELTPYEDIHAPHLEGFIRSEFGEFRLTALPGGKTLVEGQSWYCSDIAPHGYWGIFSDYFVRMIHNRVLGHIKVKAELGG